jgi:hypothetical protein
MKSGQNVKDKRFAFEELRYKFFPLEDDQTIKAFKILEPSLANEYQLISGKENDYKSNKRFLKTKFNREGKSNHRSPYSTTLWPANERTYPSTQVQSFEKILNESLKRYVELLYRNNAMANAFLEEKNQLDWNVGVCLLSTDSLLTEKNESKYIYKLVSVVLRKQGQSSNKNVTLTFEIKSRGQFLFSMNFKNTREQILLYGNNEVSR